MGMGKVSNRAGLGRQEGERNKETLVARSSTIL